MADVNNSMGPISVSPSAKGLMTENVVLAAQVNFEQNPAPQAPLSVNGWNAGWQGAEKGSLVVNLVV